MKPILIAALLLGGATPAAASDFSKLAKPAYARLALISEHRDHERSCAGLAMHEASQGRTPGVKGAQALAAAVVDRLASDLGDRAVAEELVGYALGYWSSDMRDPKDVAAARELLLANCAAIFKAAVAGEPSSALTPPSEKPLELPGVETCLAYAELARALPEDKGMFDLETYGEVREMWLNEPGADRVARERSLAARTQQMTPKPSPQRLEVNLAMACLPAISDLAKRSLPSEAPTEI